MCAVSFIGDQYGRTIPAQYPWVGTGINIPIPPSREEFDQLRRDVEALRELLVAAKRYDEATGQADCENEDKIALLRKIADLVGVDLSEVFDV